nr:MAG TPA: hypothetical protein [Caudoviricetes sp.]DAT60812.1 MAG TPA: hypothetical protein [Bacteriophage sp.]
MFVLICNQGLGTAYSMYITTHSLHDFFTPMLYLT